jgi:hypothetical protein
VLLLGGKWSSCVEHSLVVLDDACRHGLTIITIRCLMDLFKDSVGLIAVSRTKLDKD